MKKLYTKNLCKILTAAATALLAVGVFSFCSSGDPAGEDPTGGDEVRLDIPETISLSDSSREVRFRISFGKAPLATDKIIFDNNTGGVFTCDITAITNTYAAVVLPAEMTPGDYSVYLGRGNGRLLLGKTIVTDGADDSDDCNVLGTVKCGGQPIEGVVVSDGTAVTATDANGIYRLKSDKLTKYVFISIPSGYEVESDGVLPRFYGRLTQRVGDTERVDFELKEAPDQTDHTMLVFGDIHLARRTNDIAQFREFTDDVNEWLSAHSGQTVYGLTLGDMSWDLYWISNSYGLEQYLVDAEKIKNLQIFHTIGNHDHEMNAKGDFDTVVRYREVIGPNYYSFNIGQVHYVVLDDIECTNDGLGNRTYNENLVNDQLEWLEKDLEYVSNDKPIVIAMHAPLYGSTGIVNREQKTAQQLESLLSAYPQVHIITGHTHKMYNVDNLDSKHIYEHNSGAVCATWWWTGKYVPGIHICQDGTPGGYRIFDVAGKDFKWVYKPTGKSASVQFRTYDGNEIGLTPDSVIPHATEAGRATYELGASSWLKRNSDNFVYINVWDFDPEWKISVTENGRELMPDPERPTPIQIYDPLHELAYTVPAIDGGSDKPNFMTSLSTHMFRVQASDPTSTLTIKVTDRFGNTYTETMTRPKPFNADTYK